MFFAATPKITSYGKNWTQALDMLAEIKGESLQSNLIIYSACINACAKSAEWQQSVRLVVNLMDEQMAGDVVTFGAVMSAVNRASQW